MDYDLLFKFLSFSPGPFWLILVFVPQNNIAMRCFDAYIVLLSVLFAVQTIPVVPDLLPAIASPTLAAINGFLGSISGTVGAWNHMILSDLWIGRWVCHDALKLNVSSFFRIPILAIILFFGPLGLCLYLLFRFAVKREFALTSLA